MKIIKDDRRRFRRYEKRLPARVWADGSSYTANVVDYSLDGLGILFNNAPPVNKGDSLTVEIKDFYHKANGKVLWSQKTPSGLRVGLLRVDAIKGLLKDYSLSDCLIGLQRSLKTGIFKVKKDNIEKKIYVNNGDMVFAASNQIEDRLGDMLLREGKISPEDFRRSSELLRKTGRRLGAILVEIGCLSAPDLIWAVKHQVEGIILSLFDICDGEFEFAGGPLPTEEIIILNLSAGNLIHKGIKRTSYSCIDELYKCSAETIFAFSDDPMDIYQDIAFDAGDRAILSKIDGKTTFREIISRSGIDEPTARKSIAAFLGTLIISRAGERKAQEASKGISPEEILKHEKAPNDLIKTIDDMHRKYKTIDYYTLFSVAKSAPENEIKKSFYKMAKEFHPDRHFYLATDMKGKLDSIFAHISVAYNTLSSNERRSEYDRSLSNGPTESVSGTELAERNFSKGITEYKNKKFEDAAQSFAQAAYLDGSVSDYHLHYGLALARLKKPKEAERVLSRVLKTDASNDKALAELGHVYLDLGFPLRAKGSFQKALSINPSNERAKEGLSKTT